MSGTSKALEELYASFTQLNMEGGWHRRFPALWAQPRDNFLPNIWHYADVKPILDRAGELIDTELAERRNLTMFNPVEGNIYSTVRTIVAAYQMVKPGEFARAHRHTPNALRLILEGTGTYTVVNGKQVEMRPGDVLLTPNWAWPMSFAGKGSMTWRVPICMPACKSSNRWGTYTAWPAHIWRLVISPRPWTKLIWRKLIISGCWMCAGVLVRDENNFKAGPD